MPAAFGIPVMRPDVALRVRPAGKAVVFPNDVGFSVALIEAVRFMPTVPVMVWLVTTGGVGGSTVTVTFVLAVFQLAESAGVKVTF